MQIGDRVIIERDNTCHPARGTWPQFSGRRGTVVEKNVDRKRPHLTEYGVCFGKVRQGGVRSRRALDWSAADVVWFNADELTPISPRGSHCPPSAPRSSPASNHPNAAVTHGRTAHSR